MDEKDKKKDDSSMTEPEKKPVEKKPSPEGKPKLDKETIEILKDDRIATGG